MKDSTTDRERSRKQQYCILLKKEIGASHLLASYPLIFLSLEFSESFLTYNFSFSKNLAHAIE
jgi:hypothetical protein